MAGILLATVQRSGRVVAPGIVRIQHQFPPTRVEFGMRVEPHTGVQLHDQRVVLLGRDEIPNETFKERNILWTRQIQLESTKRFFGTIENIKAGEAAYAGLRRYQLPQGLISVVQASRISTRYDHDIRPDMKPVGLGKGGNFAARCSDIVESGTNKGRRRPAHHNYATAPWDCRRGFDRQDEPEPVR